MLSSGAQSADQAAQHASNPLHVWRHLDVLRVRNESQLQRKKQIILKFVQGTQRVEQESAEVRIGPAAGPLGDVRGHRNRCAMKLVTKSPGFGRGQVRRYCVRGKGQLMRMLPYPE